MYMIICLHLLLILVVVAIVCIKTIINIDFKNNVDSIISLLDINNNNYFYVVYIHKTRTIRVLTLSVG